MQPQYNGPTVVLQAPPQKTYPIHQKGVRGISITILVLGIICIILQIAGSAIGIGFGDVGAGIWCGVFFILTGSFGISASSQRTKCKIVTFMVLCILNASIFSVSLLTFASLGLGTDDYDKDICDSVYVPWEGQYFGRACNTVRAGLGLNATLIILSVVIGILSIIGSAFSCGAFCCGKPFQATTVIRQPISTVTPQAGPQPQVIVLVPSQTHPGQYTLAYDNAAFGNQAVPVRRQAPPPSYHSVGQGGQPPQGADYPAVHQNPQDETKVDLA